MVTINNIPMTVTGNLTGAPEIRRFTDGAVIRFTIAQNSRRLNKDGQWENGDATFIRCVARGNLAENLDARHLSRERLVVTGRFIQRRFQGEDGANHSIFELNADDIGVSILFNDHPQSDQPANQGIPEQDPWAQPADF